MQLYMPSSAQLVNLDINSENAQSRHSNRTVTLIVHSPKMLYGRVTELTAQIPSNHPIECSVRVKLPNRQFSDIQNTQ